MLEMITPTIKLASTMEDMIMKETKYAAPNQPTPTPEMRLLHKVSILAVPVL